MSDFVPVDHISENDVAVTIVTEVSAPLARQYADAVRAWVGEVAIVRERRAGWIGESNRSFDARRQCAFVSRQVRGAEVQPAIGPARGVLKGLRVKEDGRGVGPAGEFYGHAFRDCLGWPLDGVIERRSVIHIVARSDERGREGNGDEEKLNRGDGEFDLAAHEWIFDEHGSVFSEEILAEGSHVEVRTEVNFPRLGVIEHRFTRAFVNDFAFVNEVSAIDELERLADVMIGDQDAQPALF